MADKHPDPDAPGSLYDAMRHGGVDYRPWDGQGLGDDECFVCGTPLTAQNRTLEDVIPRWMQRELVVGHPQQPKLHLPNWTTFPLTKIKVPACRPCNGEQLSGVEQEISDAFRAGVEAVAELSERTLRIWFAKIAYGARRNDLRLRSDTRDPRSPSLASKSDLHELNYLHWLLQEARDVVRVTPGHSTFVVLRSQTVGCNVCDFDIAVPIGWPTPVMLRYRDVTIMGAVDDRGSLEPTRSSSPFVAAQALDLHPVQVRALWALLVRRALDLDSSAVPVRYAVADGRVWIDRSPTAPGIRAGAGGAARKDPLPSADTILSALIDEPLEVIRAYGGAAGLIAEPDGAPLHIPFEHGVLRLSPA